MAFPVACRRVVVVLNPAAGGGRAARLRGRLEQLFASACGSTEWQIIETAAAGGGARAAEHAVASGAKVVAAAGGDGTLGEVANGLMGAGVPMAVIPLGTGNDFARHIGVAGNLPLAVQTIFHGRPAAVDAGKANGRWFLNIASCGFDALVARTVAGSTGSLRGTAAYVAAMARTLPGFQPIAMHIEVESGTLEMRAMMCTVANASSYGGGMRIAPEARIDDGLFDVCVLGEVGKIELLRAFLTVYKGAHVNHPAVTMVRSAKVSVTAEVPAPVMVDGDVCGETPMTVNLYPAALEIMAPLNR